MLKISDYFNMPELKEKLISVKDNSETLLTEIYNIPLNLNTVQRQWILNMILWAKGKQGIEDSEVIYFICDCLGIDCHGICCKMPSLQEFIVSEGVTPEEIAKIKNFIIELQRRILENEDYLKALIFGDEDMGIPFEQDVIVSMLKYNINCYFAGAFPTEHLKKLIEDYDLCLLEINDDYILATYRQLQSI